MEMERTSILFSPNQLNHYQRTRPLTASREATIQYVRRLLDVLEHLDKEELLILVADNIDKTTDEEQARLVKVAIRLLRHPKIRLIIPLRKSSVLLRDRFSVIKEVSYKEMELHPLNLREMLRLRFQFSKEGSSLSGSPEIIDPQDGKRYSFPSIFNDLFGSDGKEISTSGKVLLAIAANNARDALYLTEKLIYSDQLKGIKHVSDLQYGLAALMLTDAARADAASSGVLDLFNNEEPNAAGNALIRFRVLEYFWNVSIATTSDESYKHYFRRLGYELDRVKRVIELFVMTQLLRSTAGYSPDMIRQKDFDSVGQLQITTSGEEYRNLLNIMWYFVSVKKDAYLPPSIIEVNPDGREYCTHTNFVQWLEQQEKQEADHALKYDREHGPVKLEWGLIRPHRYAARALKGQEADEKGNVEEKEE